MKLCHGRLSKNLKEGMKEGRESAIQAQETSNDITGRVTADGGRNFGSIITMGNE